VTREDRLPGMAFPLFRPRLVDASGDERGAAEVHAAGVPGAGGVLAETIAEHSVAAPEAPRVAALAARHPFGFRRL
jgi:hypothetical protein